MRVAGIIMLLLGLLGIMGSCSMDTTIASGVSGDRVHNIGLMNEKQNLLIVFAALAIVGAIFATRSSKQASSAPARDNAPTRRCPHCAEDIRLEAKICRYCGKDIDTSSTSSNGARVPASDAWYEKSLEELGYKIVANGPGAWRVESPAGGSFVYLNSEQELEQYATGLLKSKSVES